MGTTYNFLKSTSAGRRSRWAAVRVLGVTALALGAALLYIVSHPEEPDFTVLSVLTPVSVPPSVAEVQVGSDHVSGKKDASALVIHSPIATELIAAPANIVPASATAAGAAATVATPASTPR